MLFGAALAGAFHNASPGSVIEVDQETMQAIRNGQWGQQSPEWMAQMQHQTAAQGQQWLYAPSGAQAVAKPVDHKRMTRRKWWLVRKAIPLPWVRR